MPDIDAKASAEVTIIRNYNFFGAAIRLYPTVNGKKIAGLYTKDFVRFRLKEGKYTLGVMVPDVFLGRWKEGNKIEKQVEAEESYYFLLSPLPLKGMEIEEISREEGEKRLSESTRIETGKLSSNKDPVASVIAPNAEAEGESEGDE